MSITRDTGRGTWVVAAAASLAWVPGAWADVSSFPMPDGGNPLTTAFCLGAFASSFYWAGKFVMGAPPDAKNQRPHFFLYAVVALAAALGLSAADGKYAAQKRRAFRDRILAVRSASPATPAPPASPHGP